MDSCSSAWKQYWTIVSVTWYFIKKLNILNHLQITSILNMYFCQSDEMVFTAAIGASSTFSRECHENTSLLHIVISLYYCWNKWHVFVDNFSKRLQNNILMLCFKRHFCCRQTRTTILHLHELSGEKLCTANVFLHHHTPRHICFYATVK